MKQKLLFILLFSFAIGFSQASDSTKIKTTRKFSFEISVGIGYLHYLNKDFNDKRSDKSYGYELTSFRNYPTKTNFYPTLKVTFNSTKRKHLGFTWGLNYNYSEYNILYTRTEYYNPPITYREIYSIKESSKNHNFQSFVGTRIGFNQFFICTTLNINKLIAIQNLYYSASRVSSPPTTWDDSNNSSKKNYKRMGLGYGASLNIGYVIPLEKHSLKFELQCDYLAHENESEIMLHSINTALLVGFKF